MSVLRYVQRTREPLVVADATRDDRFARDPYFADVDCCSLLAVPILSRGTLQAVLLLENRLIRGAFTTERLDAVKLIAGQLAVSLDNAQLYADYRRIADEQAALRRVATLVARGARPRTRVRRGRRRGRRALRRRRHADRAVRAGRRRDADGRLRVRAHRNRVGAASPHPLGHGVGPGDGPRGSPRRGRPGVAEPARGHSRTLLRGRQPDRGRGPGLGRHGRRVAPRTAARGHRATAGRLHRARRDRHRQHRKPGRTHHLAGADRRHRRPDPPTHRARPARRRPAAAGRRSACNCAPHRPTLPPELDTLGAQLDRAVAGATGAWTNSARSPAASTRRS